MSNKPTVAAVVPARMTSSRLPGKVMKTILGRPVLELMLERVRRTPGLDQIVVATPDTESSQPIWDLAGRMGLPVFKGSEQDVLGRTVGAAQAFGADVIVDVASDCILCDPEIIQECIDTYLGGRFDYVSNALVRTYPLGIDVQVYPTRVLAEVERETSDPLHREHVSLYIFQHPELYRLKNVAAPPELAAPHLSLVLDTPVDLEMVTAIYEGLYPADLRFSLRDVLAFLRQHPDIAAMNQHIPRPHTVSRYFSEIKVPGSDMSTRAAQ